MHILHHYILHHIFLSTNVMHISLNDLNQILGFVIGMVNRSNVLNNIPFLNLLGWHWTDQMISQMRRKIKRI